MVDLDLDPNWQASEGQRMTDDGKWIRQWQLCIAMELLKTIANETSL